MPASSSAIRATLRLSSPAWLAQPKNTSSTAAQSSPGCFAISALIGTAARSSARTLASEPPKRPIGVRTASQMNTSRIEFLPECRALGVVPLELMASFRSVPAAGQLTRVVPAERRDPYAVQQLFGRICDRCSAREAAAYGSRVKPGTTRKCGFWNRRSAKTSCSGCETGQDPAAKFCRLRRSDDDPAIHPRPRTPRSHAGR